MNGPVKENSIGTHSCCKNLPLHQFASYSWKHPGVVNKKQIKNDFCKLNSSTFQNSQTLTEIGILLTCPSLRRHELHNISYLTAYNHYVTT